MNMEDFLKIGSNILKYGGKTLSNIFQKFIDAVLPFAEVILALISGFLLGFFYDLQSGMIVVAVGFIVFTSRILIFEWCKKEIGVFLEMYELNKKIKENKDVDFVREAKDSENALINKLRNLSNGILEYDNLEHYLETSKREIRNAENMKAIAVIDPKEWDKGGELESYLNAQIDAIQESKGKLKITRIFFLTKEEKKKYEDILRKNVDGGIEVRFIIREQNGDIVSPFVIYDDKIALIGTLKDRKIVSGCKKTNEAEVAKIKKEFAQYYLHSVIFENTVQKNKQPNAKSPSNKTAKPPNNKTAKPPNNC